MSDETKAALDAAVAAHIADVSDGNIVTDWCVVAGMTDIEDIGTGTTRYFFEGNDSQPPHVSYGLLTYAVQSSIWNENEDD